MSEADILQSMFDALQAILTVVSLFFGVVSGYLAALYFFLGRAPFALRAAAFGLLSIGFVFLGGTASVIQRLQNGLFAAWGKLENPSVTLGDLRNPVDVPQLAAMGLSQQEIGVAIGWMIGVAVYLALGYLTFVYRWPARDDATRG